MLLKRKLFHSGWMYGDSSAEQSLRRALEIHFLNLKETRILIQESQRVFTIGIQP